MSENRPGTEDTTPFPPHQDQQEQQAEEPRPWWTQPIPRDEEPTRSLPTEESRGGRGRGLTAAVLAGALVLGGAAGFGGAAWYDAWQGDDQASASSSTSASDNRSISADTEPAPSGSVQDVAARVLPSVVKITVAGAGSAGSGSGVVLSEEGEILTNNHVVEAAADGGNITVHFNDGSTRQAEIVGADPVTDIAVIEVDGEDDLTPASIGSSGKLQVGQQVVAVGSPFGLSATVTSGIVSALNRPVSSTSGGEGNPFEPGQTTSTTYPAIQTDAAINPGNSGGPLVNMSGQVVGVNSSIRTAGGGEGGSIGLGFAIPIDQILPIVNQIREGETPTHARMAVTVSDVQGGRDSESAQGALIRTVEEDGPAAEAGLRQGDVVTKVDDLVIDGSESLVATIRGHRPGEKVKITYVRDGDTKTTTVTLGSDEEAADS